MNNCEEMLELISRGLDGDLTGDEQTILDAHLSRCEECRSLARELARCRDRLAQLDDIQPPEGFSQRVMARVSQEAAAKAAPKVLPFRRRPYVRALGALAACAVLCVGLYRLGGLPQLSLTDRDNAVAQSKAAQAPNPSAADADESIAFFAAPEDGSTGQPELSAQSDALVPNAFLAGDPQITQASGLAFVNDQYLRVCYGFTPTAPAAQILGSVRSLTDFLAQFPEDDLERVVSAYGEDYFRSGRLLAVVTEESSGSVSLRLAPEGLSHSEVLVLRSAPEMGACDMAAWLILAEVDSSFADGDVLTVRFETEP